MKFTQPPLDAHFVRDMFREHNWMPDSQQTFTAFNAGHVIATTPEREWLFVVGTAGLDASGTLWEFDVKVLLLCCSRVATV